MKTQSLFSLLAIAAMALPAAPANAQATAQAVSCAKRLPPEVFAYFSIPSVEEFKTRANSANIGKMLNDPALADFRDELMASYEKYSSQIEERMGISMAELMKIPSGEVAFGVVMPPRGKIGVAAFIDCTGSKSKLDDLLDKADNVLAEQGVKAETVQSGDTEIYVYGKNGGKNKLAYFVQDETLVIGTEMAILESVLARWEGDSDRTFADNDTFTSILNRCGADKQEPMVEWYVNPIEAMMKAAQSGQAGQAGMFMGFLPALGIMNLKAMGGTIDMGVDDFDTVSRTMMYVEQPVDGVLKAFQLEAKEHTPPKWVPQNVTGFYQMRWKVADAFEAVKGLMDSFQGPGALDQIIDQAAADEDGPMVHVKKDIIDQMTGDITIFSVPGEGEGLEAAAQAPTLISFGCKDNGKMADVLSRLADTPGFPGETREFKGTQIYDLPNPAGAEANIGLAVADSKLWLSTDVKLIENVLRNDPDANALRDSDEYKRIAQYFPDRAGAVFFTKQEKQMEALYNIVRDGEIGSVIPNADRVTGDIDFSKLPAFDVIRKYFQASGSFVVGDKNGVFMEGFSLKN